MMAMIDVRSLCWLYDQGDRMHGHLIVCKLDACIYIHDLHAADTVHISPPQCQFPDQHKQNPVNI